MTRKHADYIYRNKQDTLRIRVHRRANGRWDYDVFYPSGKIATYSDEAGNDFATKRDTVDEANEQHGPLRAIAVEGNVTDPAWHQRASKLPQAHATKKTPAAQLDPGTTVMAKSAAQLDREIAAFLSGSSWRASSKKERVDPKSLGDLIKKAVKFPEFKTPSKYTWDLIRGVPIDHLDPGSKFDYETDPESADDEVDENLARYYRIEALLIHQGKKPWPVIVNQDGDVIDGHHRLAVLHDHGVQTVDVVWVRPKGKR